MSRKLAIAIIVILALSTAGWLEVTQHRTRRPRAHRRRHHQRCHRQLAGRRTSEQAARRRRTHPSPPNQVIATLEPGELAGRPRLLRAQRRGRLGSQVEASRAELAAAIAQDSEARANLTNAKRTLDRHAGAPRPPAASPSRRWTLRAPRSRSPARALNAAERQVANRQSAARREPAAAGRSQPPRRRKANVRLHYTRDHGAEWPASSTCAPPASARS